MRALPITAAVVTTALMLSGCPNKRPQPVPGPQSAFAQWKAGSGARTTAAAGGTEAMRVATSGEASPSQATPQPLSRPYSEVYHPLQHF
jgi:hypothetical protein